MTKVNRFSQFIPEKVEEIFNKRPHFWKARENTSNQKLKQVGQPGVLFCFTKHKETYET